MNQQEKEKKLKDAFEMLKKSYWKKVGSDDPLTFTDFKKAVEHFHQQEKKDIAELKADFYDWAHMRLEQDIIEETFEFFFPYIHSKQEEQAIQGLLDVIDSTITGMEWVLENKPECFSKADADHLQFLQDIISQFDNIKNQRP